MRNENWVLGDKVRNLLFTWNGLKKIVAEFDICGCKVTSFSLSRGSI